MIILHHAVPYVPLKYNRMKQTYVILLFSALLFSSQLNAQNKTKEHKIKGATGVAVGGATTSLMQVKQMAINNAKVEALKKAGIEEHINSYTDYFRSESDNKMEELFTSDVLSNIRGSVKNIEDITYDQGFTAENQIKVTATINCIVVEYITSKDLTYVVEVDGVKPIYKNGDYLEFKVTPTQECYMRAFMFSETEDFIFIPNDYEPSFQMAAKKEQYFPTRNNNGESIVDYPLEIDGDKNKETNRVVLVFLKKDIPYTGIVAYEHITAWIMTIPPDERVIESFAFDLYKNAE